DFDGAYRQGLALLALHASGATASATAIAWLEDQQCGNGLWLAFRADTALPCPPADPGTFSGPDTNSTALGALGLSAQGRSASALEGVDALLAVRTSTGGWGFVAAASVTSDANSDAVVLQAIKAVKGQADAAGLADLEAFQLGCDAPTTDRGAIRALDFATSLPAPNVFATVQSVPALAGAGTYAGAATIDSALPEACAPPAVAPGPTDNVSTVDVAVDVAVDDPTAGVARDEPLARTGSPDAPLAALGSALIGAGGVLLVAARRRRHATLLT
ncbi:MAG: hypothetical protein ABIV94_11080, partial [Acidimicrobiales bacterium]